MVGTTGLYLPSGIYNYKHTHSNYIPLGAKAWYRGEPSQADLCTSHPCHSSVFRVSCVKYVTSSNTGCSEFIPSICTPSICQFNQPNGWFKNASPNKVEVNTIGHNIWLLDRSYSNIHGKDKYGCKSLFNALERQTLLFNSLH